VARASRARVGIRFFISRNIDFDLLEFLFLISTTLLIAPCVIEPQNHVFQQKGQNGLFTTKSVHEF